MSFRIPPLRASHRASTARLALAACLLVLACPIARAAPLSAADLHLLDALTWGANPSSAAQLRALGREKWLDAQLVATPSLLPEYVQERITALATLQKPMLQRVAELEAQQRAAGQIADPEQKKAAQQAVQQALAESGRQAASRAILRALYAPDQLRERLTWFWFNHFNVHLGKANLRLMVGDYEDNAIRPHALGRFRDLLGATVRHPAMLRYLDNAENAAGRLNENYAREIMELHTMGVGSGYSQTDVEQLARILTGLGIDSRPEDPKLKPDQQPQLLRDGLFEFNPARHDYGDKVFLGHTIRGSGMAEVEEALDLLSRHPATARRVARDLAVYFVADRPADALVQRMAAEFTRTDGDIAAILRVMVHSPEFKASLGTRFKDPVRYILSAVRLAYDDKVILNTLPIQNWLNRLAEGLFNHDTPDGFPLTSVAWNGPGQMITRFEIARQIGSGPAGLFKPDEPGTADRPAFPQLQNSLYFDALGATLSPTTRAALEQATSPQDWNTLFLASPEFMQ